MESTTNQPYTQTTPFKDDRWQMDAGFIAYLVIMSLILVVGIVGNVLTILVLQRREHQKKQITPLMINLALTDIFIIVFGYPVVMSANVSGFEISNGGIHCVWSGFINGSVGIAAIANLTMMSLVMYNTMNQVGNARKLPTIKMAAIITFTWLYGIMAMFPPLVGWNEFVPSASGVSCCPNWTPNTKAGVAYIFLLVFVGFLFPLCVICVCYYKIYRFLHLQPVTDNTSIQASRRKSEIKLLRMIAMSIAAFVLSWSPYCIVSVVATIRGSTVLSPGEAEVPDLLAKASVVYNPIVYTVMNDKFRASLRGIVACRLCRSGGIDPMNSLMSNPESQNARNNASKHGTSS